MPQNAVMSTATFSRRLPSVTGEGARMTFEATCIRKAMSLSSRSITTNPDGIAAYVKMPQKVVILTDAGGFPCRRLWWQPGQEPSVLDPSA
mmetsp:Transcript_30160/g.63010  ORF Transcript_30160/g.63010 Transcript_30160/m.63010 type:complete len:91 (+) Transcript_30160:984-1256(+)